MNKPYPNNPQYTQEGKTTIYKGIAFRSRLEARWAVFFDCLGIEWRYEPRTIHLAGGVNYIPDFFLPYVGESPNRQNGSWIEVKPGLLFFDPRKTRGMIKTLGIGLHSGKYFIADSAFRFFHARYNKKATLHFVEQFLMKTKHGILSINNNATTCGKPVWIPEAIEQAKRATFE